VKLVRLVCAAKGAGMVVGYAERVAGVIEISYRNRLWRRDPRPLTAGPWECPGCDTEFEITEELLDVIRRTARRAERRDKTITLRIGHPQ
jgi:hypothetical protein